MIHCCRRSLKGLQNWVFFVYLIVQFIYWPFWLILMSSGILFYMLCPLKNNKSFILFSMYSFSCCSSNVPSSPDIKLLFGSVYPYMPLPQLPFLLPFIINNAQCHVFSLPLPFVYQVWLTLWSDCWPSTTTCLKSLSLTPWAGTVRVFKRRKK